jgi:hypothetical protein
MLPLILGIGAAALLLGRKAVKRAGARSNPRRAVKRAKRDKAGRFTLARRRRSRRVERPLSQKIRIARGFLRHDTDPESRAVTQGILRRLLAEKRAKRNPAADSVYFLQNRIAHLRGLIREAPPEDKAKLREILKLETDRYNRARLTPRAMQANPARRRKGKRVSVDQAASRLAWWRWHHNPKRKMTRSEARAFFDAMYAGEQSRQESRLRSPAGEAERQARNRAALARLRAKTNPRRRRKASRRK